MPQSSLDTYYRHRRTDREPLKPKKLGRTSLNFPVPDAIHRTSHLDDPKSQSAISQPLVRNPLTTPSSTPSSKTELGVRMSTSSSSSSSNNSLSSYLRDVISSEVSSAKPLSTEFNLIITVFDSISSVFISLGHNQRSVTWDELYTSVQSVLNQQKVDFTLNIFRKIVALCPGVFTLSLSYNNALVISTSCSTVEWFNHRSLIQDCLRKRMEAAHSKYLKNGCKMSDQKSKIITSKSKVWEVSFLENYIDPLPLCSLPEPRVTRNDDVSVTQHDSLMDKIQKCRDEEKSVVLKDFDLSVIPKDLVNFPREVLALTLHRQENARMIKTIEEENKVKRKQERLCHVSKLLTAVITSQNLRSLMFRDAVQQLKVDFQLQMESEVDLIKDVEDFVEQQDGLILRKNRIIVSPEFG
ncbi:hypothetical protein GEMRC1_000456 [Eukaryota sp. GEM-RC1]